MHIFFQCNSLSASSEKIIKILNFFDYFSVDYLRELKIYNQEWIKKRLNTQIKFHNSHTNPKKRIKYTNASIDDRLLKLENVLYEEGIKGLLSLSTTEKLILLYNYIIGPYLNNNQDKIYNYSVDNSQQNKESIQYILFLYIKILSTLLNEEEQKPTLMFMQELLENISNNPILLSKTGIEIGDLLDNNILKHSKHSEDLIFTDILSDKHILTSNLIKNNHFEIIETIKLFPYKNIIIIPILSNYYNIYILLFKKHFNISFSILEVFERQLMKLKRFNNFFFEGWLLLSFAYYKLFSYKKSKRILKYCQSILYFQKQKILENNDTNNYKLNYYDTIIVMLQGCSYYSIKKYEKSIMRFKVCVESNIYYEYSLWNLYLIYKQQQKKEEQMEILFILIQITYQRGELAQNIPMNLIFLRMFQLLYENQSEEEVLDFINNICLKKDILLNNSSGKNDISTLSLFRTIFRYSINKNNIEKAIDIFTFIKDIEPFDIIGSIYFSELLISQQHDTKLILRGIKILNHIKNYINFVEIASKEDKLCIMDINDFSVAKDRKIFSNELLINILSNNNYKNHSISDNRNKNEKDKKITNPYEKFDILIGFEQDNIEKYFDTIYQYMKANKLIFEDFCYSISSQHHLLSIVNWHLSYSYYSLGYVNKAYDLSKEAYILDSENLKIAYNYCILSLKIFGVNTYEKTAYEWRDCRNNNKNIIYSEEEVKYKKLDQWVDEIIKYNNK
ncbi:hypothetical protein BCR36DRAFT_345568 [Piromyces finnis]|uniref:TPR-like protein n=1 Tax=Piromyces finnis TaxID=1754191 RepID=A0A1Y1VJ88_9FUNG|nr:hypothetical protein BCR36DRAFT_345568 [Piromyces finnis]|eukprot:ORX56476.1 hypothetical protein BCR36DRAFT_345568 [Piromyces finnis]